MGDAGKPRDRRNGDLLQITETRRMLDRHGGTLVRLAAASIGHGLANREPLPVDPRDYPAELRADGACFVTLTRKRELRGCVGSPQAHRALVEDVAANAFAAGFRDDRFPMLTPSELRLLELSVSVLSPPQPIEFTVEAELLAKLRPGIDGLIIAAAEGRALFLPQVWEVLPAPQVFLAHLKAKAGLSPDYWSGGFKAWRFTAESVSSAALAEPSVLWDPGP